MKYIDKSGNWTELDESKEPGRQSRFHKSESGVRFENRPNSPKPVMGLAKEPIVDTIVDVAAENYDVYREFLKSKKVKGWQLLKGENIKTKAISNGYPLR